MRHLTAGSVVCVVWLLAILQVSCLKIDYYYPKAKVQGLRFGINFKPSPFVAIKYESASERVDAAAVNGVVPKSVSKYWIHSAQVAVSF